MKQWFQWFCGFVVVAHILTVQLLQIVANKSACHDAVKKRKQRRFVTCDDLRW